MTTLKLRDGDLMPAVGLGTWQAEKGVVAEAVYMAVKNGYRHVDCAAIYGNEKEVGEAFKRIFDEGIVKREELWVTSKLWCDRHERGEVIPALEETLADLGLDYLDLYLVHWPIAFKKGVSFPEEPSVFFAPDEVPITETWAGMEDVKEAGMAKHVGVSNFSPARLENLVKVAERCGPEVNQVECHPFLQQGELLKVCEKHGVILTGYSPLGSGKGGSGDAPDLFEDAVLKEVGEAHGVSAAQVALAWGVGRGCSVIPKSTDEGRQKQNLAAGDVVLTDEEMGRIGAVDAGYRYIDGTFFCGEGSPYSIDWLWEGGDLG